MKYLFSFFCIAFFSSTIYSISAQNSIDNSQDFLNRSPIYDYSELQLNNTDTIPGFDSKLNKLKITGTIYKSDGITPAKDVILYIDQADENGDFDLRYTNEKRYVHNRGWIKTDIDGTYTFYTYIPGNDRRYNQMQQLFPIVKEPSKDAYEIASFLFDDDPFLTKMCRKRMAKKGDPSRILKLKNVDGIKVVQKNIVLSSDLDNTK
ncbi:peptidase associated/transthyretin-like domain-containing protein [Psychroserpens ponticola]|uniref:Intradiol ring-cleavage dioxygenases domain-containing protein n=1 Tax=Psychroserpens ponticola TaxID=2932268 RepID=A0ABY7S1C9_9FLAO|nr:hypothetical protein [Psychroserpens ponticola]WCO03132.1 hypothetical protein MUN68_006465 [Psychroserpens ponticola]